MPKVQPQPYAPFPNRSMPESSCFSLLPQLFSSSQPCSICPFPWQYLKGPGYGTDDSSYFCFYSALGATVLGADALHFQIEFLTQTVYGMLVRKIIVGRQGDIILGPDTARMVPMGSLDWVNAEEPHGQENGPQIK